MVLSLLLLGCKPAVPSDPVATGHTATPIEVVDMASYLAACEAELGTLPDLDCRDAVEVPITVTDADGTTVVTDASQLEAGIRCDRASIAGCDIGTRIGAVTNDRGSVFAFGCRNYDDDPAFDQLNVVATHPVSGATCFFSTESLANRYGDGAGPLPRPGSPEDLAFEPGEPFWYGLDDLQRSACLQCHDNDPIVHDPWIEQVGVLPEADPLAPTWLVAHDVLMEGSELWQPPRMLVHPDAAPCLQCHRLTDRRSCTLALEATGRTPRSLTSAWFATEYPQSRWMPELDADGLVAAHPTEADWEATWGAAADAVAACCGDDPPAECFAAPGMPGP